MKNLLTPTASTRVVFGLMALAVLSRWLPHPPNFTPVIALALFGGAAFANRAAGLIVVLGAMLISDLLLGWHTSLLAVYGALAVVVLIGHRVAVSAPWSRIAGHGFAGALVFFLLSNLAVWLGSGLYPPTLEGLVTCYTMALPFFGNTLAATVLFGAALFGLARRIEQPRHSAQATAA